MSIVIIVEKLDLYGVIKYKAYFQDNDKKFGEGSAAKEAVGDLIYHSGNNEEITIVQK